MNNKQICGKFKATWFMKDNFLEQKSDEIKVDVKTLSWNFEKGMFGALLLSLHNVQPNNPIFSEMRTFFEIIDNPEK